VLVIVDDFSRYVELVPTKAMDAESTATALQWWFARYGICSEWCSDRGTHFMNEVMERLRVLMRATHHFTAVYAPWSNGKVERMNRELRETLSAIMVDGEIPATDWVYVLPAVLMALYHSVRATLGGLAPVTAFMGTQPTTIMSAIYKRKERKWVEVEDVIEKVRRVSEALEEGRAQAGQQVRQKRGVSDGSEEVDIGVNVGDYVLTTRLEARQKSKAEAIWEGPARVIARPSAMVYRVKDVASERVQDLHARFIKRIGGSDMVVSERMKQVAAQGGRGYVLESITGHRVEDGDVVLEVKWESDGDEDVRTWEPLQLILKDAKSAVMKYARLAKDSELWKKIRQR
jgi:hypothetical protein